MLLVTRQLVATNQQALKYYVFIGAIYFIINTLIEFGGKFAEKKISHYMGGTK
jgi:ABC-type amino acid transport system permease subunit